MLNKNHTYHLVEISPWPILGAFSAKMMMMGLIKWFHFYEMNLFFLGSFTKILIMYQWWRDFTREGTFQGLHTYKVVKKLRWGMNLFITPEVLFFVSFFWTFYHSSLSHSIELGMISPPMSIIPFNPIQVPFLNTTILISSGITDTWAHHSLMENNYNQGIYSLVYTIILGLYFTALQGYAYLEASFTIADSVYGSWFFMATGFHGIHVIIGTVFLTICFLRQIYNHYSSIHHFGFEAAPWYWHFVDVVWLFLYISIYWWGS
nr:cytochrome c oxidase subunit 3 [Asymmetricata circumdata]